jgi:hypothetical protein
MALDARRSQEFVPIKEVRDGIIILKDGGLRAVLVASSINLSLKSDEEQKAVIANFQNFLNGLDFSIQIVVQSRRLDIRPYLLTLEERMKVQVEPLIKIQTKEYMDFIQSFTNEVNIMTKSFFVVVPYSGSTFQSDESIVEKVLDMKKAKKGSTKKEEDLASFEEKRSQLDQRIAMISQGLGGFGVRSSQLGTEEIIEMFYKTFNPGDISQGIKLE